MQGRELFAPIRFKVTLVSLMSKTFARGVFLTRQSTQYMLHLKKTVTQSCFHTNVERHRSELSYLYNDELTVHQPFSSLILTECSTIGVSETKIGMCS